ncbi:MAG: FtsX-like permease family protein [Peptococcaceae bacterium]|nr:FtsX-like permease family protein [Peptococcaceae bacterium]
MLLRKLLRTAWLYKGQFISMIVTVCIGVGIFLGFQMEWKSIEADTAQFFEETNYADFRLYDEAGFSDKDLDAIEKIDGVDAASRYLSLTAGVKGTDKSVALNVPETGTVSVPFVLEGADFATDREGIWLSDRFAAANNIAIGDEMTLTVQGKSLTAKVVGLCKGSEDLVCVSDSSQMMPDFESYGYAFISDASLRKALGRDYYPQLNIRSTLSEDALEEEIDDALDRTIQLHAKDDHLAYSMVQGETDEGKTMGTILPVIFLAIGLLTMVTTMHRIAAAEKIQMGTLQALGFRNRKIVRHYACYGLFVSLCGTLPGIALGYGVGRLFIDPDSTLGAYFDLPAWPLVMPSFCVPVVIGIILFMTLISHLSVRQMLKANAAETLRPYEPRAMKQGLVERLPGFDRLGFSTRWNLRDLLRHKIRVFVTLFGIVGCMLLLVGGLGMKDSTIHLIDTIDDNIYHFTTRLTLADDTARADALALADEVDGDWQASSAANFDGESVAVDVYQAGTDNIRFIDEDDNRVDLADNGVYLCLRLADGIAPGDEIEFSPYGSDDTYTVRVAGILRSLTDKSIIMTDTYAEKIDLPYQITTIYTRAEDIPDASFITASQRKSAIIDSFDEMMDLMNLMVYALIVGAIVLSVVVLYNLGTMSYIERRRDLSTLKVLGFRDGRIARLLIQQNLWLTLLGIVIGYPVAINVLRTLIEALVAEYEMRLVISPASYIASFVITCGVSLAVSWLVARKNRHLDMVEALKNID